MISWTLLVVAVLLLIAVVYARYHPPAWTGFGVRFLPRAKTFIDDLSQGAQRIGIAPCDACGYDGYDRQFRHVSDMYLCDACIAPGHVDPIS